MWRGVSRRGNPEVGVQQNDKPAGSESPPYMIGEQDSGPPAEPEVNASVKDTTHAKSTEGSDGAEAAPGVTPTINVLTEPSSEVNGDVGKPKPDTASTKDDRLTSSPQGNDNKEDEQPEPEVAEWGNSIYRVRFPGDTPKDGIFRPPYGWRYSFFMEEAVEEVPEYVVPWEAFRASASSLFSPPPLLLSQVANMSL